MADRAGPEDARRARPDVLRAGPWKRSRGGSAQLVHPAVRVLPDTALDAEQGLAQLQGDLAGRAVAVGPGVRLRLDMADRRDDRGGAAGEDLGEGAGGRVGAPLVQGDDTFLGGVAEVAGDLEEGVAGDALEDRAGERRRDDPVAVDEGDVHRAGLLDLG